MTNDQIKKELQKRIDIINLKFDDKISNAVGFDKAEVIFDRYRNSDGYYKTIIDTLNDILVENNVSFDSDFEKGIFVEQLKPTIQSIFNSYLKGK